MAIVLGEPAADALKAKLAQEMDIVISAATLAEALIVSRGRGVQDEMGRMIEGLGVEVAPVTHAGARGVAEAYARWGKGVHPAQLNFGDCFAYELAKSRACPLLFVGEDFSRTDVTGA